MSTGLLYNRDENIDASGLGFTVVSELQDLSLYPVYGSTVDFESKSLSYETKDGMFNSIPASINNLSAVFKLRFDVEQLNAQKLVAFFESKKGENPIKFSADSSLYRTTSGFCDNYAVNHIGNKHYEVASTLMVDQAASVLTWSGMTFVDYTLQNWSAGVAYTEYDIVYSGVNSNKLNNFFYCSGNHTSSVANSPTGANSMWTQKFFFEPDVGFQNEVTFAVKKVDFKTSFPLRIKTDNNIALTPIDYKFSNVSTKQAKAMLHFLENKLGYRKFEHQIPSVYNKPKIFSCPKWSHSWVFSNAHDINVSFIEDPLGVIQSDT